MRFFLRDLRYGDAAAVAQWRYESPYDVYDFTPDPAELAGLMEPGSQNDLEFIALAGGRASKARLALMTFGVGLAVSVLLGGLAFNHGARSREARIVDQFQGGLMAGPDTPKESTLIWGGVTTFDRQNVQLVGVHGSQTSPVPLGLSRMPATGEAFVSPGLQALIDGPDGDLLATGLGGSSSAWAPSSSATRPRP